MGTGSTGPRHARRSEVSEIIHGNRQVRDVEVLERVADGLGVPRPLMRLLAHAPGDDDAYGGEVTVTGASEGVSAEMLRRHVLALGGVTAFGVPIKGLGELLNIGELLDLGGPAPVLGGPQRARPHVVWDRAGHHPCPRRGAAGVRLAHGAITDVVKLSSVQARTRLAPLAAALATRPGCDAKELARQVAATRA